MIEILKLAGMLGSGWLKNRQAKQQQQNEIEVARVTSKIKRIEKNEDHDNDLDEYFVKSHGGIQKLSFIIFLLPAVMAFIGFDEEVMKGFEALKKMPTWYQYTLGGMMIAIWGYRKTLNKVIQAKLKTYTDKHLNGNGNGKKE